MVVEDPAHLAEEGRVDAGHLPPGRLHLYDVGPHVAEDHGGVGAEVDVAEVQDAYLV